LSADELAQYCVRCEFSFCTLRATNAK